MYLCPLCGDSATESYCTDKNRQYYHCGQCYLVFVPEIYHLNNSAERAIYDQHENVVDDPGYRRFLSRIQIPLDKRLSDGSYGLDFGCGPGPALAAMLEETGHRVNLYDVFYYPDSSVLAEQYDFVTATEVIEHLHSPERVWKEWLNMLKPDGWLGIMTKLVKDVDAFSKWHYKNDLTHVSFFSQETFKYLAKRDKLMLEFVGDDVIFLRKPRQ